MTVNGGVKNWISGEVLDAADLNAYVANQIIARFADISARTAAYGVAEAPSLQKGLFSWVDSTEKLYYYDGSAWEEVGAQVEDLEITTAKIAALAVTEAKIASDAVTTAKIADSAVTSAKIADGTIVNADVNASASIAYSKLTLANSITTTDLASGAPRAGFRSTQNAQVGTTYTLALTDLGALVELNNASPITLTVPSEATIAFAVGDRIDIVQTGTGQVTVVGATSPNAVTVNGYDGGLKLNGQWAAATLIKRATNTWLLIGNITT
jgi:hypothetical protein